MTIRFGGKLELIENELKTSTIEARKLFLTLICDKKPEIVHDLLRLTNLDLLPPEIKNSPQELNKISKIVWLHSQHQHLLSIDLQELEFDKEVLNTPLFSYFDFIFKSKKEFDKLYKKSKKEWKDITPDASLKLITKTTLQMLIPNWNELKSKANSELLCSELNNWSEKWNLKDDWCLDFALDCLRNFKLEIADKMIFSDDYILNHSITSWWLQNSDYDLEKIWNDTAYNLGDHYNNYFFPSSLNTYPTFQYAWLVKRRKIDIEVFKIKEQYNPLIESSEEFRKRIEKKFWKNFFSEYAHKSDSFVGITGQVSKYISKFELKLNKYIDLCERKIKPFTKNTPKKESNTHFRWLVDYQILEISYKQLATNHSVDRKTMMDGVKHAADLVDFRLRPQTRGGRKKGVKDKVARQKRRNRNY